MGAVTSHHGARDWGFESLRPYMTEDDDLRDRITQYLMKQFPQIQMHGGDATIQHLDKESGEVVIQLGGACSGCGISPMTIEALKRCMVEDIPEITTVHASTGMDQMAVYGNDQGERGEVDTPDAPF